MPKLIVQSPEFAGRVFELLDQEMTVGRLPDNVIHIDHGSVSGHHAVLVHEGGDYLIKDLNSTNGTRINGTKVAHQRLQRGDILQIGNIQLEYQSELQSNAQPLPQPKLGVDLQGTDQSVIPSTFRNASPFGRKKVAAASGLANTLTMILAITAAGSFAFLLFKLFVPTA